MDPTFEVIRFQVAPASSDVAIIELEGRPADAGTIGYEILTALGPRYHRIYRPE